MTGPPTTRGPLDNRAPSRRYGRQLGVRRWTLRQRPHGRYARELPAAAFGGAGRRPGGLDMADVVVVGGGSAGCVLAARLSEDPGCEVTLLEAGPDLADVADLPPDVVDASGPSLAHDWGYVAEPDRLGRCIALPRARLIGGCSATNWSFDEVLPFFRRLEADADFGGEWHDTQGPLPIRRHPPAELNPVQAAFIEAACAYGLAY